MTSANPGTSAGTGALPTRSLIEGWLAARLFGAALDWQRGAQAEIAGGVSVERFSALLSTASRHAKRVPLGPSAAERAAAAAALPGFEPERWSVQEAARVALVLARGDLAERDGEAALEEAFRYADEGELCALYRSLAHLPAPERFAWRAKEGCRTNMVTVFEANVLDTPLPAAVFDDVAWNQAAIKCVFVSAPLWRLHGLDGRLSPELARMALDLVDERRSAGRPVQHELWLALGPHGAERGLAALERELSRDNPNELGRAAAAYGLARAGAQVLLAKRREREPAGRVHAAMTAALAGDVSQAAFRHLDPR
jgi:hypothetical protein